jgi:hypothetical protein
MNSKPWMGWQDGGYVGGMHTEGMARASRVLVTPWPWEFGPGDEAMWGNQVVTVQPAAYADYVRIKTQHGGLYMTRADSLAPMPEVAGTLTVWHPSKPEAPTIDGDIAPGVYDLVRREL